MMKLFSESENKSRDKRSTRFTEISDINQSSHNTISVIHKECIIQNKFLRFDKTICVAEEP